MACACGLSALALTDHNTVDGLERAFRAAAGRIALCGGCEFTTEADGQELHLLGLFLDPERLEPIRNALKEQQRRKEESNRLTIESLAKAGYPLSYEEFISRYGTGMKNRVHIARYLIEKGIVHERREAFGGLLSSDSGYYIQPERLDFYGMIPLISKAGGVSVWAHPLSHVDRVTCERVLCRAKACGLDGMEVYYSTHSEDDTAFLHELCDKYQLLESGGSDFHGESKPGLKLGSGYGDLCVPFSCYETLKRLADERKEKERHCE